MNWDRLHLIGEALKTAVPQVFHFDGAGQTAPYAVWGEDGTASEKWSDNKLNSRVLTGTVDYFTRDTEDPALPRIEAAMETAGIVYHLESVQFEDSTGICHYEWTWEFG